jgi:hypothetical protein
MTADNLVIQDLADGEALVWARVRELERERTLLRDMVSEALTQLSQQTAHLTVARQRIRALESQLRRTTETVRVAA